MTRYPFRFEISRTHVIMFWVVVLLLLIGIFFLEPEIFYRVTQMPYQNTPFVNTPSNAP